MTACSIPSFTSSLFIDREHPVFGAPPFVDQEGQPTPKLLRLRTPGNGDAVAWSVFRTLLRLDAERWLPALLAGLEILHLSPAPGAEGREAISMDFWPPPFALDVVIRAPGLLLAIAGKLGPLPATKEGVRDTIGHALDAALDLAEAEQSREVAFLLVAPRVEKPRKPLIYDELITRYRAPAQRTALLPDRSAADLKRLDGRVGWLT